MLGAPHIAVVCGFLRAASPLAGWPSPPARTRSPTPTSVLGSPFPSPELSGADSNELALQTTGHPVKVMVFIDGSWLYYSFHGRRPNCPVTSAYGRGWEYGHSFDYNRLPQLISKHLHDELLQRHRTSRFVEIVRTVVFSSARADTHHRSTRMRMFRQMEDANFEVHMSVTTGIHEKCIDISLAVEMMHYASVEGAYDIAVLVSPACPWSRTLSLCIFHICERRLITCAAAAQSTQNKAQR